MSTEILIRPERTDPLQAVAALDHCLGSLYAPQANRILRRCGDTQRGPFGGYPDNGLSVFVESRL